MLLVLEQTELLTGGKKMRLTILVLSIASIVFYGHALAGLGGYFLDKGRPDLIIVGLTGGTSSAIFALWLWKKYLTELEKELNEKKKTR